VNTPTTGPAGPIIEAEEQATCPCHDAVDCPDEATVAISARELAHLGELLTDIDEFLRCGNGVVELLADFYGVHRGHRHPRLAAHTLIDLVSFAAPDRRGQAEAHHAADQGGQQ
jgi:hypothetical protein